MAGVGANERSTIPKGTPNRRLASVPTSCPIRVILKAVFLIISASSCIGRSFGALASAALTTPGPETPTLITQSASPTPWKAPAINGLSSGALQKITSLAAPIQLRSWVSLAASTTFSPIILTASILIPAFVEPIFTEAQTWSVCAKACGIAFITSKSPAEKPFWTSAEKPPIKLTPTLCAQRSKVKAYLIGSPPLTAASIAIGVTEIRLLITGIPYSFSISLPVLTKSLAKRVILL